MKSYFRRVEFYRFKAFSSYRIDLKEFNILVGPNNAGKSTIIAAFRILAAAIRKANSRKAEIVNGPRGQVRGYKIDLSAISVAEENLFYNYDEEEPAHIKFTLSSGYSLTLYFLEQGACNLIADADGKSIEAPNTFRRYFDCDIGFVPILGPVEHNEPLYEKEAARQALFNYRAARNFRNIWYHYPEKFAEFREALQQTWPGMDVEPPEISIGDGKARLYMYCPEKRVPREIFWAGFGFQVWCQMLTHLIQSSETSLFLIDEPDVYLHSELQRQLLDLLRNLGPDILIATHSTEIVTEANFDEILVIDKERPRSRRIKNPTSLSEVFSLLGSNLNPVLTQLAKTRRVLFVEGKDFQILGRFAKRLRYHRVGNRSDFAVVPIEGFNPEKMKNLLAGMEKTLGTPLVSAAVLDRDYRSTSECDEITKDCKKVVDYVSVHRQKEIENFLLVPDAIDRAIAARISARPDREAKSKFLPPWARGHLEEFAEKRKAYIFSQFAAQARKFERLNSPGKHETTVGEEVFESLSSLWTTFDDRLGLVPGKEAVSWLNELAQEMFGVSVTSAAIIEQMTPAEVPVDMKSLIEMLDAFSRRKVAEDDAVEAV